MKKQLGPLKLWQWGAIVGGGLGLYLLLHHKKEPTESETLGPLKVGLGSEGGGGLGETSKGLEGTPGPVGAPGPEGKPGEPGGATSESKLQEAEHEANIRLANAQAAALNNPPIAKARTSKPIKNHPRSAVKGHNKRAAPKRAKMHKAIHRQAAHERRSTVRVPPAKHGHTGAGAVAHRSHGLPSRLSVSGAGRTHGGTTHPAKSGRKPKR